MARYVVLFLRASLAWLVLGAFLGVAMTLHPIWMLYRTAHLHMMLLGFVTMMIAGVAYHVIPRFGSTPLWSPRLAMIHWLLANVGLTLLLAGFVFDQQASIGGPMLLVTGGALSAASLFAFGWNIWRTLDHARDPMVPLRPRVGESPAPRAPLP